MVGIISSVVMVIVVAGIIMTVVTAVNNAMLITNTASFI